MEENYQEPNTARLSVIIASNRGPVTFQRGQDGELALRRGSGGLVTALTGLIQHIDASWVSCAMSEEDSRWREGQIPLTEDGDDIKYYIS